MNSCNTWTKMGLIWVGKGVQSILSTIVFYFNFKIANLLVRPKGMLYKFEINLYLVFIINLFYQYL